ncbi:hypothetical protein ACSLVN_27560, partial [Klebsiella pneumoniae]|uniref:hypothetical protein n=1 Tax=Klebsiella pneumoniae TaxID=573 RepID=UPI003EE185BD
MSVSVDHGFPGCGIGGFVMFVGHDAIVPLIHVETAPADPLPPPLSMKHGDKFAIAHCPAEKHLHA